MIDPTHAPHVFQFIAAKRGNRIGWSNEDGAKAVTRHFCHASDGLYWREATPEDMEGVAKAVAAKKARKPRKTAADMKALVPPEGAIPKTVLIAKARDTGFSKQGADDTLKELLDIEELFTSDVRRSGTNAKKVISRHRQPPSEQPQAEVAKGDLPGDLPAVSDVRESLDGDTKATDLPGPT